jgi:hypothetical protein
VELLVLLLGIVAVVGIGAAMVRDALRHRVAAAVVGATFGVFGLAGLLGALFFLVLPAYRRAQARRGDDEPWRFDRRWSLWRRPGGRPPYT